jgi:DNA modification methylase
MIEILEGDATKTLAGLAPESFHCCVTSPPYWGLRDYGIDGQLGLEATPEEYVERMVEVFRGVRRVLRDDGTLWLNLGDSYATGGGAVGRCPGGGEQGERFLRQGHINTQPNRMPIPGLKPKDLCGIPWRVAFALQSDGWYLRSDIIWSKLNPMPESVTDRPTKAHEYLFLLAKSKRYYFDADAVKEPVTGGAHPRGGGVNPKAGKNEQSGDRRKVGFNERWRCKQNESFSAAVTGLVGERNIRTVWTIATQPFSQAHFATFPPKLVEPCIKAGCPEGGTVLDPFGGAGTTGLVADRLGRNATLIEINPDYAAMARGRIRADAPLFAEVV